jgi:hypothetical protein
MAKLLSHLQSLPTAKLCRMLEEHLAANAEHLFAVQHRDGNHKRQFSLKGSFKVGTASTNGKWKWNVGKHPYFKRHNFKNTVVWVKPPLVQLKDGKICKAKFQAWLLASMIIERVDPNYAAGEYEVNFSMMNSAQHYVKKHIDGDDISHQYALGLGQYSGAMLRVWSKDQSAYQDFDYRHKILKLDGRNYHELVTNNFQGERFTVIWYKVYDHRMTQPDPICDAPAIVLDVTADGEDARDDDLAEIGETPPAIADEESEMDVDGREVDPSTTVKLAKPNFLRVTALMLRKLQKDLLSNDSLMQNWVGPGVYKAMSKAAKRNAVKRVAKKIALQHPSFVSEHFA